MPPELETSFIVDEPSAEQPLSDIAAISELISGGDPEQSEPPQEAEAPPEAEQPPEMAEQGEIDTAPEEQAAEPAEAPEVDYNLEVPMPDGMETMTVGQLKDHYRETKDLEQERETWEAHQSEQQLQLMAARRELTQLADLLKDVKPEVIDHVRQMNQRNQEQEQMLLLQTFPDWADADKKAAARASHVETVKEYGFTEMEYASINDHRIIKAWHDLTQYRKREAAGKARAEQLKAELPKGQKPVQRKQSAAQKRAALINRARSGNENDKIAAISSLISEG